MLRRIIIKSTEDTRSHLRLPNTQQKSAKTAVASQELRYAEGKPPHDRVIQALICGNIASLSRTPAASGLESSKTHCRWVRLVDFNPTEYLR